MPTQKQRWSQTSQQNYSGVEVPIYKNKRNIWNHTYFQVQKLTSMMSMRRETNTTLSSKFSIYTISFDSQFEIYK